MNQITSYTQPKTLPAFLAPSAPVGIESVQKVAEQIAELGRYEDNYIVHASEGETVVPLAVLNRNPGLKDSLFKQMRQMGLDPERYIVGSQLNSINPVTGQPEFFLKKLGKGFKNVFKTIAPIVLPAVLASTPPGPYLRGGGRFRYCKFNTREKYKEKSPCCVNFRRRGRV